MEKAQEKKEPAKKPTFDEQLAKLQSRFRTR
jgi:hypothetical protein